MSFIKEHADDIAREPGAPDKFTGNVYFQPVAATDSDPVRVARVTFAKGARTHWHVHTGEQVLYFLEGRGRVQLRGENAVDAANGDVAHIPPATEHWHGAHPEEGHAMRHLAITFGETIWLDAVSEDQYGSE